MLTQSQRAASELRDRILAGQFAAGSRLFEVELSETLGVSRTPLREALGILEFEGLLERRKGGGFSVRAFSFEDVRDAIDLRGLVEGTIARHAAERGAPAGALERMRAAALALDAVVAAGDADLDFDLYTRHNGAFHAGLHEMAGSSVMRRELAHVLSLPFANPDVFLEAQTGIAAFRRSLVITQAQHRDLLEAIEARQGARAEFIAREHARQAWRNLEALLVLDRHEANGAMGLQLIAMDGI